MERFRNRWLKPVDTLQNTKIPQIAVKIMSGPKASLIRVNTDTNTIDREHPLQVIRYENSHKNKNTYPWLQDMKAFGYVIICLFTGSPSPLQEFSLEGELRSSTRNKRPNS